MLHLIWQLFSNPREWWRYKRLKKSRPTESTFPFVGYLKARCDHIVKGDYTRVKVNDLYKTRVVSMTANIDELCTTLFEISIRISLGDTISSIESIQLRASENRTADDYFVTKEGYDVKPATVAERLNKVVGEVNDQLSKTSNNVALEHYCGNLTYILRDAEAIVEALEQLANL